MIDITNLELFKDLTTVESINGVYDLHNDYNCVSIVYDFYKKSVKFLFQNVPIESKVIFLNFDNATIVKCALNFYRTTDNTIVANFYRGKFESGTELMEYSHLGEGYFYIEFEEGDKFEILSNRVYISENN